MNLNEFQQALESLSNEDWQAVLDGAGLVVEQDARLIIGDVEQPFVVYEIGDDKFENADQLKQTLIKQSEPLWREYYQFNPFSKQGFYRKAKKLIDEYGPLAFVSTPKNESSHRMFVEDSEVVAVTQEHPVYKYAFHLKLDQELQPTALTNKVNTWLNSGSAYEDYICVNVCRFGSQSA